MYDRNIIMLCVQQLLHLMQLPCPMRMLLFIHWRISIYLPEYLTKMFLDKNKECFLYVDVELLWFIHVIFISHAVEYLYF